MVKYVPDNMNGFGERPHYEPRELDDIAHVQMRAVVSPRCGSPMPNG